MAGKGAGNRGAANDDDEVNNDIDNDEVNNENADDTMCEEEEEEEEEEEDSQESPTTFHIEEIEEVGIDNLSAADLDYFFRQEWYILMAQVVFVHDADEARFWWEFYPHARDNFSLRGLDGT